MPNSLPMQVYRALADDYRSGMSLAEIEAKRGCSKTAVKTACAMLGVPMRSQGAPKIDDPERFARIRTAVDNGMSRRQARKAFNASDDVIRRALGEAEVYGQNAKERYHAAKAKRASVNRELAAEVDLAMRKDRERLKLLDAQRALRRAA